MTAAPASKRVFLREWEASEADDPALKHASFGADEGTRQLAAELSNSACLQTQELATGLRFQATSFVGRVRLGEWEVTIQPKIPAAPLLTLLRYAYRLRDLDQHHLAEYAAGSESFQDLLIQQLSDEAAELLARGLHRNYVRCAEDLTTPRGRLNFGRYARMAGMVRTTLPCVHHPRSVDTLLNRTLLAGLHLARRLTTDLDLRAQLGKLVKIMELGASPLPLDSSTLARVQRSVDRRTAHYESALALIELLFASQGFLLDETPARTFRLPGFLFDMNRFFQSLISRFLHENLEGYEVSDEHRLHGMFLYDPQRNPRCWRSPTPRPDFVVRRETKIVAVLDAKYRDLWQRHLPREMLYQLALYALWQHNPQRRAVILYPIMEEAATEQAVHFVDPFGLGRQAEVLLRPVHLPTLASLVQMQRNPQSQKTKVGFAQMLAFGGT